MTGCRHRPKGPDSCTDEPIICESGKLRLVHCFPRTVKVGLSSLLQSDNGANRDMAMCSKIFEHITPDLSYSRMRIAIPLKSTFMAIERVL